MEITFDFSRIAQSDIIMAIIGYVVVFASLLLLYVIFQNMPRILNAVLNKKPRFRRPQLDENQKKVRLTGEVNAAIAAALYHYYNELHDEEDMTLTINKVSRNYSPWSSKIYSVMNNLKR